MTFPSVAQANSNMDDFARLLDLFDRVAARRNRALTGDPNQIISKDDMANVPAEFAPILKNLSPILSLRALRDEEHARRAQVALMTRARRNTLSAAPAVVENPVDAIQPPDETDKDAESERQTFPLGERYPFTFNLRLHKLYDLDEWAEKVRTAVETSKSQFKPLAERVQNVVRETTANIKEGGEEKRSCACPVLGVSAKFKPPSVTRHSTAMPSKPENISSVRPVLGRSAKFKPPSTTRLSHPTAMSSKPEVSRVLKKRCIGRRKSLGGPLSTGVWVYDAAISATEITSPPAVEITLSMPRNARLRGVLENRARHQSLSALEEMRARDTAKRKVKITVPLLQEETSGLISPQPSSVLSVGPARGVMETRGVVKKRRSVASAFALEPCKAAVKRPLCI